MKEMEFVRLFYCILQANLMDLIIITEHFDFFLGIKIKWMIHWVSFDFYYGMQEYINTTMNYHFCEKGEWFELQCSSLWIRKKF